MAILRNIKKFICILILCMWIVPASYASGNGWKKNDSVGVRFICRFEEDIMEVAKADIEGMQKAIMLMQFLASAQRCVLLQSLVHFKVKEVVMGYTDFKKKNSVVLKVYNVNDESFEGFVIAHEIPKDIGI
tara:strand:+ start:794 stop:1186 length:393 start_codon:yes stop_codon:yes gene_type:complete